MHNGKKARVEDGEAGRVAFESERGKGSDSVDAAGVLDSRMLPDQGNRTRRPDHPWSRFPSDSCRCPELRLILRAVVFRFASRR
jgi:hypothetical protein